MCTTVSSCDLESFESKICCQTESCIGCRLTCMTKDILRKSVVGIGSVYLIISLLPVSYYIMHALIPKIILQNPQQDLQDLQLTTLSIGVIIALFINLLLNLAFLMGVEMKLVRKACLIVWLIISTCCITIHGSGLIWCTYAGLGSVASTILNKRKTESETKGDQYFQHLYHSLYSVLGQIFY